jgi:hypothetical protein
VKVSFIAAEGWRSACYKIYSLFLLAAAKSEQMPLRDYFLIILCLAFEGVKHGEGEKTVRPSLQCESFEMPVSIALSEQYGAPACMGMD